MDIPRQLIQMLVLTRNHNIPISEQWGIPKHNLAKYCLLFLALLASPLLAQEPEKRTATQNAQMEKPSQEQIGAIEQVSHWIGEWSGTGWSMSPDRQRQQFEIFESVAPRLNGSVLLVEGKGISDDEERTVSHESLAILSFDSDSSRYKWRTYDLRGTVRDPEFVVESDAFRWGFRDEDTGMLLKFTIVVDGDTWYESGEVSPDQGENWYKIMEMNLARQ